MDHLLGWLKPLYEFVGVPWPRVSLFAVMILSAIVGGGIWTLVGKQVEKDHRASTSTTPISTSTSTTSINNSTSGAQSPAISGNGNNVTYNNGNPPDKKAEPPKGKGR
jgi:hypothetical protein